MKYALKRLFGEEFANLLKINVISSILCMFIVTIGPVIVAMKALFIEVLDSRCPLDRVKEFFRLLKKNFIRGCLYELAVIAYILMLVWAVSVNDQIGGRTAMLVALGISGLLGMLASVTVATVLAASDVRFTAAVKQGIYLAFGQFPFALMSAVCVYSILLMVYLFYPISFVPLVLLGISTASALSITFMWPSCYRYILVKSGDPETCDKEEQEIDVIREENN